MKGEVLEREETLVFILPSYLFILGWALAANTRYPFPEYAPKGVIGAMD